MKKHSTSLQKRNFSLKTAIKDFFFVGTPNKEGVTQDEKSAKGISTIEWLAISMILILELILGLNIY